MVRHTVVRHTVVRHTVVRHTVVTGFTRNAALVLSGLGVLGKPRGGQRGTERPAEVPPLSRVAAHLPQRGRHLGGLDALGD